MEKGDYVLATKYSDGDPADAWCVGYYIAPTAWNRHLVGDANAGPGPNGYRFSGFEYVALIDEELGNWLVRNAVELEKAPPCINLWAIHEARTKYLAEMAA